ncbi:MAG: transglycosylase SLT domain-containing protein [Acidobacteria bacterium]|nr:transglycosylase SLT domain-containing protein [Acidobacteriota bacterium]
MQKTLFRNPKFYYSILLSAIILIIFSAFVLKYNSTLPVEAGADRKRVASSDSLRKLVESSNGKPTSQDLLSLEQKFPKSRTGSLSRFLRAYLHFTNKDFLTSSQLFDEDFIKQETLIGDYALYYQARSYQEIAEYNKAKASFLKLAQNYPDSLFARESEIAAGNLTLNQLNDPKTAIKLLSRLADNKDGAALLITAQSHEKLSQTDLAINTYRKIYYETPESSESAQALTRLTEIGIRFPEIGKQAYELSLIRANKLFQAGLFAPAVENYQKLKTTYIEFPAKPTSELNLGISLYKLNRFREATLPLQNVPSSEKELFLEARYYLANSFLKQKLMSQFVETANQVLSLKPSPEKASELLGSLVDYYDNVNESQATRYRNQLIKNYPDSKEADKASYKVAWKVHNEKRYAESSEALVEHLANIPNPEFRGQAIFWAACDAERAGQLPRAMALYEALLKRYKYNYYGYLTLQRIAKLKQQNISPQKSIEGALEKAISNIKPATPLPETATEKATPYIQKADQLHEIGLDEQALNEVENLRKDAPNSHRINFAIATIYRDRGENFRAVVALQRAHPDYSIYQGEEVPKEVYDIFFPLIEWETIKAEATRQGLDPYTVAGLIRQESVFDPRARSRANALGLMQLLPSTGQLVARKQGVGKITNEQLYNPQLNIKLGTAYLAEMLNKFGKIEYAAAAYNGGPGRVDRWLNTLPSNIEDWVEAIPITETRLYVFGVMRNSAQYRRIYGGQKIQTP